MNTAVMPKRQDEAISSWHLNGSHDFDESDSSVICTRKNRKRAWGNHTDGVYRVAVPLHNIFCPRLLLFTRRAAPRLGCGFG